MEDFGDILYILAMLAALVFSALRKKKKVKEQSRVPDQPAHSPFDPLEEEDDVLADLKELFKPEKKAEPEPVFVKEEPQKVQLPKKYKATRETIKPEAIELISLNDDYHEFEFDKENLDLRQAVIYSEILNRPYH